MTLNEPLLKLWYIREYSERRRRVERRRIRRRLEEEDSYKKGMNDKEWIYGRQLCLLLFSVQLHTVHAVNEKTIGNFKEQMVFKTRGWIAFVYTSPLKVCYKTWPSENNERKKYSGPTVFLFFSHFIRQVVNSLPYSLNWRQFCYCC